jgi:hypothetical protein
MVIVIAHPVQKVNRPIANVIANGNPAHKASKTRKAVVMKPPPHQRQATTAINRPHPKKSKRCANPGSPVSQDNPVPHVTHPPDHLLIAPSHQRRLLLKPKPAPQKAPHAAGAEIAGGVVDAVIARTVAIALKVRYQQQSIAIALQVLALPKQTISLRR